MSLMIGVIQKHHEREHFDCGEAALNLFLKDQARQATERRISTTYVACFAEEPAKVMAYHTLTHYNVAVPPPLRAYKGYRHPLPAIKLARLAVDLTCQKLRLGELLLIDAIKKTVEVGATVANIGLYVDPMTPAVVGFYEAYGFARVEPEDPEKLEMWLHIESCAQVVKEMGR